MTKTEIKYEEQENKPKLSNLTIGDKFMLPDKNNEVYQIIDLGNRPCVKWSNGQILEFDDNIIVIPVDSVIRVSKIFS